MNERIRRIMEQAIMSVDGQLFGKTYVPDEFTEKFAELIVRECAMFLDQKTEVDDDGTVVDAPLASEMLEHFGVEE